MWREILLMFCVQRMCAWCTIDVNLAQLEYIAARLNPFECRRLVAALHYNGLEMPKTLAERTVGEEIPCINLLLHWNNAASEGQGRTHQQLAHRLRQINKPELANWLGKATFQQLSKDLEKSMDQPFGDTESTSTTEIIDDDETHFDQDSWFFEK